MPPPLRHLLLFLQILYLGPTMVHGQLDSTGMIDDILAQKIEPFLNNLADDRDFDFNTLEDQLHEYLRHPLNVNTAGMRDLQNIGILTDLQISNLLQYRSQLGNFLSIYELQSIPSFDKRTLDLLRHFVRVTGEVNDLHLSPSQMAQQGENEIYLRWSRVPQTKRGYQKADEKLEAPYAGDPNQYYVRFRHNYQYKFSYGLTLEKDPGEKLWEKGQKSGPDFLSYHIFLKDYTKRLKFLALGDYSISLGQGLIMHSGFGGSKSSLATQIKRGGQTVRPYTSVNEASFLRGAAVGLAFGDFHFTAFGSSRKEDANLIVDSLDNQEVSLLFSSLPGSGLHRTEGERENQAGVRRSVIGASLGLTRPKLRLNINAVHASFDREFVPNSRLYNQFYVPGRSVQNASFDYTYIWRNFHLFGEGALSQNGGRALIQGMLISLSRYVDLALLYRNIDRSYQGIQPNAFLESSRVVNEQGIYLGSKISLHRSCWLNLYADFWSHPWLSFSADAPTRGREYMARFTYYEKRKMEAYIQYRNEIKARNYRTSDDLANRIFLGSRKQVRIQLNHKVNRNLELRNRIEFSHTMSSPTKSNKGFIIYQDIIYKPITSPLSFTARLAYFDIEDYAARIYAYENDILYSFSIPAYFGEGIRYYLNIRHKINKTLTCEVRWEETRFRDRNVISSGNEEIDGSVRSRFKIQLRAKF